MRSWHGLLWLPTSFPYRMSAGGVGGLWAMIQTVAEFEDAAAWVTPARFAVAHGLR